MAVDNRPFKSKEQDGQGNEVIIRDQQLVEQGTTTTMPAGACFQTLDVDGRPVKIPKDNMLNLIVEGLGIIFNGQSDQQTVTKVPTLNGNNFGASTVATLASVLGATTSALEAPIIESLEASYQSVGVYTLFSGCTATGGEAGWYGFKRADDRISFALISYSDLGFFVAKRHPVLGWSATRLIQ